MTVMQDFLNMDGEMILLVEDEILSRAALDRGRYEMRSQL